MKATDKTVITFRERPAGQPEALHAWFYPGREWGEEFVYPKAQAIELAKATTTTVLEMPATVKEEAAKPEEPRVITELKETPVTAVEPSGKEVEIAQAVTPPPAAETLVAQSTPEPTLPKDSLSASAGVGFGRKLREHDRPRCTRLRTGTLNS